MNAQTDARFDAKNAYREEMYTDRRVGAIRVLVPVQADGSADATRPTLFIGQISISTPMGTMPLGFDIEVATLAEAIAQFGEAARGAVDEAMRELQQMRREQASSIVIPEPGALPPAGGGGRIRMP